NRYFPEYTAGPDINKAAKYILWRFMQANRARLSVYPHLTQATDITDIRLVLAAVKETILQNALKDSGILRYAFRVCFSAGKSCVRVFYKIPWSDVVYNLCVQFTFISRERRQLALTPFHPSWFLTVLLPHDICQCWCLDAYPKCK
ncbi:hypothetical protein PILCRDRAFT_76640, partial [Piloderma croceum F 1598]